eukprot:1728933-Amphidinium_carterae.1
MENSCVHNVLKASPQWIRKDYCGQSHCATKVLDISSYHHDSWSDLHETDCCTVADFDTWCINSFASMQQRASFLTAASEQERTIANHAENQPN